MSIYQRTVETENNRISYTLTIKNVKNINMRVRNHSLYVSANAFIPIEKIDAFVLAHKDWILKQLKREGAKDMIGKDYVIIFGNKLRLKKSKAKQVQVYYESDVCYIYYKEGMDPYQVLEQFLNQLAYDVFLDIACLTYGSMKIGNEMPNIKIRTMKSRWGSCIPSKNSITLNQKLIHYPIEFIEYVVLHEFAHFLVPNHSSDFYAVIERYMPDYKRRIQMMKQQEETV